MVRADIDAQVAVVGGGPAGLTAAITASGYGARVVLMDEKAAPGGQLFKQIHKFFGSERHRAGVRGYEIGRQLLDEADRVGVETMLDTTVWGLFPDNRLAVTRGPIRRMIRAERIVLATGAGENPLAFPGWTLPGVMGAGAAQTCINVHRVRPGTRALVVGSGNVGLIVAYQLLQAGVEVAVLVEALPRIGGYRVHAAKIQRAGVPILVGHTVVEARGAAGVERAVVARADERFRPVPGTEIELDVDLICIAVGLTPAAELCRLAGCRMTYAAALGGYMPAHDRDMRTSLPGVYVAGDVAGIEEASTAMEEGRLAGVAVAESLGRIDPARAEEEKAEIWRGLDALRSGPFGAGRLRAKHEVICSPEGEAVQCSPAGKVSPEELRSAPGHPDEAAFERGPMAVIECEEEIPCNPCEVACRFRAIRIGSQITELPHLIAEKCRGCGRCIPACPGLAIFVVDKTYSDAEACVRIPYEYLPVPHEGDVVDGLDRHGERACTARVVRVDDAPGNDGCRVVWIAVPKAYADVVRGLRA